MVRPAREWSESEWGYTMDAKSAKRPAKKAMVRSNRTRLGSLLASLLKHTTKANEAGNEAYGGRKANCWTPKAVTMSVSLMFSLTAFTVAIKKDSVAIGASCHHRPSRLLTLSLTALATLVPAKSIPLADVAPASAGFLRARPRGSAALSLLPHNNAGMSPVKWRQLLHFVRTPAYRRLSCHTPCWECHGG